MATTRKSKQASVLRNSSIIFEKVHTLNETWMMDEAQGSELEEYTPIILTADDIMNSPHLYENWLTQRDMDLILLSHVLGLTQLDIAEVQDKPQPSICYDL